MKTLIARKPSRFWLGLGVALVALLALLAVTVGSGQWQIRPILSGSMRPGLPVGGVAVTDKEPLADLHVRDVVVTHPPGEPHYNLVHRITQIYSQNGSSAVVQTMGDANTAPDPFKVTLEGPYVYKVRFTVPLIGYPAVALHSERGRRTLLCLAVLMLGLVAARMWLEARRKRNAAAPAVTGPAGGMDVTGPTDGTDEQVDTGPTRPTRASARGTGPTDEQVDTGSSRPDLASAGGRRR